MPGNRRAIVQRQLTWWASDQPPATTASIWEKMDKTEQLKVIAALAKLIGKTMQPESSNTRKEGDHEQ
jgi:hypothetical protein